METLYVIFYIFNWGRDSKVVACRLVSWSLGEFYLTDWLLLVFLLFDRKFLFKLLKLFMQGLRGLPHLGNCNLFRLLFKRGVSVVNQLVNQSHLIVVQCLVSDQALWS